MLCRLRVVLLLLSLHAQLSLHSANHAGLLPTAESCRDRFPHDFESSKGEKPCSSSQRLILRGAGGDDFDDELSDLANEPDHDPTDRFRGSLLDGGIVYRMQPKAEAMVTWRAPSASDLLLLSWTSSQSEAQTKPFANDINPALSSAPELVNISDPRLPLGFKHLLPLLRLGVPTHATFQPAHAFPHLSSPLSCSFLLHDWLSVHDLYQDGRARVTVSEGSAEGGYKAEVVSGSHVTVCFSGICSNIGAASEILSSLGASSEAPADLGGSSSTWVQITCNITCNFTCGDGDSPPALDGCLQYLRSGQHCSITLKGHAAFLPPLDPPPSSPSSPSSSSPFSGCTPAFLPLSLGGGMLGEREEGGRGREGGDPSHEAVLQYNLTLLDVLPPYTRSPQAQLASVNRRKERGNAAFHAGQYQRALGWYDSAYALLRAPQALPTHRKEAVTVWSAVLLNKAEAFLRLHRHHDALFQCDTVLREVEGRDVKALVKRARAQEAMGDVTGAEEDLLQALLLAPNDPHANKLYLRIRARLRKGSEEANKVYKRMFDPKAAS